MRNFPFWFSEGSLAKSDILVIFGLTLICLSLMAHNSAYLSASMPVPVRPSIPNFNEPGRSFPQCQFQFVINHYFQDSILQLHPVSCVSCRSWWFADRTGHRSCTTRYILTIRH